MALKNLQITPRRRASTIQVIDSIAEVTRYLDKELIEKSLLSTLSEFEPDQELRLYKVVRLEPGLELTLSAFYHEGVISLAGENRNHVLEPGLAEAIDEVVECGDILTLEDRDEQTLINLYPVFAQDGELYSILVQIAPPLLAEDQRLISGLLRIYTNYLSLLDLSQKDKLTNLLNRDRLEASILEILAEQRLAGTPHPRRRRVQDHLKYWLAVIDVDHFKRVNDEFGHLIGDEILIIFARLLHEVFRGEDLLFRFGGEEFVAIIRADTKENARRALERFRTRVESHPFPQIGCLTASLGVVELDGQATPSDVIDAADKAMYHAKNNGRNQTVFHEDLIEMGEITPMQESRTGDIELF